MYKILIAEAEYYSRKVLAKLLSEISVDLEICEAVDTSKLAIEYLEKNQVDLVITDIRMPEIDGLEVAKYVAENCPKTHVIIESGYSDFNYAKEALIYGVKNYLTKPIKETELDETIQNLLEERKNEKKQLYTPYTANTLIGTDEKNNLVEELKNYVSHHFGEKISLNELANHKYFMNPSYLSRLFKSETGMNFSKYLIRYRMEISELKVNEVGSSVGYNDTSYFIYTFKKTYDVTPEQYRRSQKCYIK